MTAGIVQGLIMTAGILWALVTATLAASVITPDQDSPIALRLARFPHPLGHLAGIFLAALWPVVVVLGLLVYLVALVVHAVSGMVLDTFYRRRP